MKIDGGCHCGDITYEVEPVPEGDDVQHAGPRTLAGAAVVLRRALAAIGDTGKVEARLVGAALGVVEAGRRVTGVAT